MKYLLFFCCCLFATRLPAQNPDSWTAFYNKDSSRIGFKNAAGKVMIPPGFSGFIRAQKLDHIMAADSGDYTRTYYLTRSGRTVARDSVYFFDNTPDCEREGFIRFTDYKTDKRGLLNRNGDVVIPAIYNELTQVRNGMVIALKDAEKIMDEGGEHYRYKGGRELLIDTLNQVLVYDFPYNNDINFYSVRMTAVPAADSLHKSFRGVNSSYYVFEDYAAAFKGWLHGLLKDGITQEELMRILAQEVTIWHEAQGWVNVPADVFTARNFSRVKQKLEQLNQPGCRYDVFSDSWALLQDNAFYNRYLDNCGDLDFARYPSYNLAISHTDQLRQDNFTFLRTENGYRLVSAGISDGELK